MMSISPLFGQFGPYVQLEVMSDISFAFITYLHVQRRPCAANATRHVCKVKYDKAMCVGIFALKTERVSSRRLSDVRIIDAHIYLVVVGVNEASVLCVRLAEVVGVALSGGIRSLLTLLAVYIQKICKGRTVIKSNMLKKFEIV